MGLILFLAVVFAWAYWPRDDSHPLEKPWK